MSELNKEALELAAYFESPLGPLGYSRVSNALRSLVAENERLAKDAERYQKIRKWSEHAGNIQLLMLFDNKGDKLDAAIDEMRGEQR